MSETGNTNTDAGQNDSGDAGEQSQGDPQLQALTERMDQLAGQFSERFDGFDQLRDALAPHLEDDGDIDGAYEDQGFDPNYADPIQDDLYGEIDPQEAMQAQQRLQQMIRQEAEGLVGPLKDQVDQMRIRGEANDIARELPDLDDPEKARAAMQVAQDYARQLGVEDLAGEPRFIRLAHLARRAEAAMQQETPAGGPDRVQLEGAGGTPQALADAEQEFGDRIVNAGPKNVFGALG